jgi:hypothetical protein
LAGYFRYGNSTVQFDRIVRHAERRLQLWIAARHQQPWHYGRQAFNGRPDRFGLITLNGTIAAPRPNRQWRAGARMPTVKHVGEPCAGGSSRQGCDPAGESPATSVVHVGREATPHPDAGNRPGDAWCERPGGPAPWRAAVGAVWRPSECRSPKVIE